MKKKTLIIALVLGFIIGNAWSAESADISGNIYYDSQPLCTMVLANGSFMFTNPTDGRYELDVPLDSNGKITLFVFCDGFAPFKQLSKPEQAKNLDISMTPASSDSRAMNLTATLKPASPGYVEISGTATYKGIPLCIMVLANGQHMFTNALDGMYKLTVPLDREGKVTLFGFCDGFAPYKSHESIQTEKRNLSPDVSDADLNELVNGNSEFAFDFYHELLNDIDGNIFFSPHSISTALAMTYAGARNNTEKQMADVLNFTLGQDSLHPAFNALDIELASRSENENATDGEGFRLNIANSLWAQDDYPFLSSFLDMVIANYDSGITFLDFARDPEGCRTRINNWVYDKTETKVEDLIPEGNIDSVTRLVLVNAIYFNAAWKYPFPEYSTWDGIFYLPDNSEVTVPLMFQQADFRYAEGENYQIAELPYDGEELSMIVLLPQEGQFEAFEKTLTFDRLDAIMADMETEYIQLILPKFSFKSESVSLVNALTRMGMEDAFIASAADFSGIDGYGGLFISEIFHKAFVAVDEAGTEAAAATAVIMGETAVPPSSKSFTVDRPFIFFIRDIQTGAILFAGRIVNPVE